jgi:hypothetical protein
MDATPLSETTEKRGVAFFLIGFRDKVESVIK